MQRDMDLMRDILLAVQERTDAEPKEIKIDGHPNENVVTRHIELLHAAKYLEIAGNKPTYTSAGKPVYLVKDLTWDGHQFISAIKNDEIWSKLKSELSAAKLLPAPTEVIKYAAIEIGKSVIKQHLGLAV